MKKLLILMAEILILLILIILIPLYIYSIYKAVNAINTGGSSISYFGEILIETIKYIIIVILLLMLKKILLNYQLNNDIIIPSFSLKLK